MNRTLKQMADSFVRAIEALSVHPVELAHADGQVGLGRFHQQMIMIGHQTVGVADPTVTRDNLGESLRKELAVVIREKDLRRALPRAGQMIDRAEKLQTKRSCYVALVSSDLLHCRPDPLSRPDDPLELRPTLYLVPSSFSASFK